MSYRTYVNDVQILGNNECYEEWINFIKSQGIEVSEDKEYKGEIIDIMGAIITLENIIIRLENERMKKHDELVELIKKNPDTTFEEKMKYLQELDINSLFYFKDTRDMIWSNLKCDSDYKMSVTDYMTELIDNGYVFMTCTFLNACKDKIERDKTFSTKGHYRCWKIKAGEHIYVSAS